MLDVATANVIATCSECLTDVTVAAQDVTLHISHHPDASRMVYRCPACLQEASFDGQNGIRLVQEMIRGVKVLPVPQEIIEVHMLGNAGGEVIDPIDFHLWIQDNERVQEEINEFRRMT